MQIPILSSDYRRATAKEADIFLRNRYFEQTPTDPTTQSILLARPGMRRWLSVGDGPIRCVFSQPGSFDDAIFVISDTTLFKIDRDENVTNIGTGFFSATAGTMVSMTATGNINDVPPYLFIADGRNLWLYIENGYATSELTSTGAISNNDKVSLGSMFYKWTTGSVDTGTPAGTTASPWLVALGGTDAESLANLSSAINENGVPGTDYSTALDANPEGSSEIVSSTVLRVRATPVGTLGNDVTTTVVTGAHLAWTGATLSGGGDTSLTTVETPDDVGMVSVGTIESFVICVCAQGAGVNGRFYWIEPGETTIDPLNFATAERSPDPVYQVVVVGDQFWLPGENTTEVWHVTGDETAPMERVQGILFDSGVWEGTAVPIKDVMVLVGSDGAVYSIAGGITRISDNSIEERIRKAMQTQTDWQFNIGVP